MNLKHRAFKPSGSFQLCISRAAFLLVLASGFFLAGSLTLPGRAIAVCVVPCVEMDEGPIDNATQVLDLFTYDTKKHLTTQQDINDHTDEQFEFHKQAFMIDKMWSEWLLPNWKMLTEQISTVAIAQMEVIGTFLDAKHQLETQRLFGQLAATAYKDYTPSEGLCTIVSLSRSLGGSERNVDVTSMILSRRSLDRQLLKSNTTGAEGGVSDRASRFVQFQKRYCDPDDNAAGLAAVCQHDPAVPNNIVNKDVDFFRTLGHPVSLDLNLSTTATEATSDEKDLFALQSNLYGHQLPDTLKNKIMKGVQQEKETGEQAYLDMRAIAAKRSVAENSYNEIAALKARGQTDVALTGTYLRAALEEMGLSAADATTLIGENPSYYSQMEILTKKMFQRPEFFVDLYDKTANVERKSVALQAISIMQRRDIFKSQLRMEAMISLILELDVARQQIADQNETAQVK